MRLLIYFSVMVLAFSSADGQAPNSLPMTAEDAELLEAYVDGIVTAHMRQHRTPGVTVSVVKDGRRLFAKGYGLADMETGREVLGDDTLFRIGSLSKTFIWTSVMMLVERGQLDLDTDVNEYLQGVEIPPTFEAPVTLDHLMAHRAGFESTIAVFTHSDTAETSVTDALNRDMPARVFPPGVRTSYSNWGATLASKIVADVSGKTYEQFLQDEIFTPLGMIETTLNAPALLSPERLARMSVGFEMKNGSNRPAEPMQIGPHAPAGAIASTAADMARWMLVHLGGGQLDDVQILSHETHARMWTRAFADRASGADLAHGFITKPYYGYATFGHGGATSAFYTNMLLVPDLELGVFVSQNATGNRGLVTELPDLIIERLASADRGPGQTTAGEEAVERATECAGEYLNNRRSFTKFERLFATQAVTTVAAGEDGSVIVTSQGEAVRYTPFAGAADTYQDDFGNRIVFGRDGAGAVSHYSGSGGVHSYERIGALDSPSKLTFAVGLVALFSITTWLGVLWRRGVPATYTATGKFLGIADCVVTVAFLAFIGAAFWSLSALSSASASDLIGYPPTAIKLFRAIALPLFFVGIAAIVSLWPAWRSSGWTVWRKLHHTLFALSLLALAFMMLRWNIVFASLAV